ncbi:MAG: hypothetical protein FWH16_01615 [Oscillospiraceae bacterium]|nr:hypothetical protein [Oscillospiraceae bacterium]
MTLHEHLLLNKQAKQLAMLDIVVDQERIEFQRLIKQGIPHDDPRVSSALERLEKARAERELLSAEYDSSKKIFGIAP